MVHTQMPSADSNGNTQSANIHRNLSIPEAFARLDDLVDGLMSLRRQIARDGYWPLMPHVRSGVVIGIDYLLMQADVAYDCLEAQEDAQCVASS